MKTVQAVKLGFLPGPSVQRVRPGQVVTVPSDFEADWFVVLTTEEAVAEAKKPKIERPKPTTLSQLARSKVQGPTDLV